MKNNDVKNKSIFDLIKEQPFKILLINLFCLVPAVVFFGIFSLIFGFENFTNNIYLIFLLIIACYPFFIGVNNVCYKIISNKSRSVFTDFLDGFKENLFKSVVLGIIIYILASTLTLSLTFYRQLALSNPVFWTLFVCSAVILMLAVFFFFDVNSMTVIFDLKLKDILKNSLLSVFGELKNNFLAFIKILIPLMIIYFSRYLSIYLFAALLIIAALIGFSLLPLSYINQLYRSFVKTIAKNDPINDRSEKTDENTIENISDERLKEINSPSNDAEYIFYNGRMMKKSEFIKIQDKNNNLEP